MLTEKTITIRLIDGWTKKMSLLKTNYHSALDSHRSNKIKLELKGFITIYIKSMHRISPEI